MNPERIRAAIRMLYPAEMTPTARNVLENILDAEELEAVADAAASSMTKGDSMGAGKPMTPFDQAVSQSATEFREELEAARAEAARKSERKPWWKRCD